MRKKSFPLLILILFFSVKTNSFSKDFKLYSPNKQIEVQVQVKDRLYYSVIYQQQQIISPSPISMVIDDGTVLGKIPVLSKNETKTVNEILTPVIKVKTATIKNNFNELIVHFKGDYALIFRAFDDGVAYRLATKFDKQLKILEEEVTFNFIKDHHIYFPEEERLSVKLSGFLSIFI